MFGYLRAQCISPPRKRNNEARCTSVASFRRGKTVQSSVMLRELSILPFHRWQCILEPFKAANVFLPLEARTCPGSRWQQCKQRWPRACMSTSARKQLQGRASLYRPAPNKRFAYTRANRKTHGTRKLKGERCFLRPAPRPCEGLRGLRERPCDRCGGRRPACSVITCIS